MDSVDNRAGAQSRDVDLWRSRSKSYDRLKWASDGGLLHFFIEQCEFKPGMRLLDVGTGTGHVLKEVQKYFDVEMFGLDISPDMIKIAGQKIPDARLIISDVQAMGLPEDAFDIVTARMMFHHVDDVMKGLREVLRVLKPGGRLVFCEGVPPDYQAMDEYIRIFELKEKRHTFLDSMLLNLFHWSGFMRITLRPYYMHRVSLNNWLQNSELPKSIQDQIYELHVNASPAFQELYRYERVGDDLLMDWKFVVLVGEKPA